MTHDLAIQYHEQIEEQYNDRPYSLPMSFDFGITDITNLIKELNNKDLKKLQKETNKEMTKRGI